MTPIDDSAAVDSYSSGAPSWRRLLEAVLRARVARRERDPIGGVTARNLSGCLRRLMLGAVVVFLALLAAVLFFGHALLQSVGP